MKSRTILDLLILLLGLLIGGFIVWAIVAGVEPPSELLWVVTLYVVFRALSITRAADREDSVTGSEDGGDLDG